jgi:predicted Zn-dependent protease with MMP-like domain
MSQEDFESAVDDALDSLPESVVQELEAANVVILVEQEPDPDSYGHMVRHGELLGLYVGTPLDKRSTFAGFSLPDQIFVYRGPLQRVCRDRAELVAQIRVTVLHEIGHLFGLSERRLHELGWG